MFRRILMGSGLLVVLLALFFKGNIAFATSPPTHGDNEFAVMEKICDVIDVQLHGNHNPTITCAQKKTLSGVSPRTEVKPCTTLGVTMRMFYNSDQNEICFFKTGYWGYRVNNVDEVTSSDNEVNGWFLWYYPGSTVGSYCNLDVNNNWTAATSNSWSGEVEITQIDPGARNGAASRC